MPIYKDAATQRKYKEFKTQGMTDSDIEKSGIFIKDKPMAKYIDPVEKAYNQGKTSIRAEQAVSLKDKVIPSQTLKTGNSYGRAKRIMQKALTKSREAVLGSHAYEGETQQQRKLRIQSQGY
jgi:hypothetical protein